jgi:hypothetical protein
MKNFYKHVVFISILKLCIIFFLPLTGDEAYFIKWANHLDLGFYDHPPMVGWLIHLMQYIGDSYVVFRLFSFFTIFIVAFFIYKILLEFKVAKKDAEFIALVLILMPTDILLSLFTNDIPLLLFGVIGTYFFIKSLEKKWITNSIIAGVFFGFSFLSKYFAVFLMLGLLIYAIKFYRVKALKSIFLTFIVLMPFVFENLYYNYNSCWNNILFNFFARTENSHYQLGTILGYLAILLYIFTPWGVYYLYKSKDNFNHDKKLFYFILLSIGVGLGVFFIVSLKKKIGLHWLLLFLPYIYMLFLYVKDEYKERFLKYSMIFTYIHIAIILILLSLPIEKFKKHKKYRDIVFYTKTKTLCEPLKKYKNLYTTGYTSASIVSYYCKRDIKMILNNSKYGRLDDKLVDVRDLKDKEVDILFKSKPDKTKLNSVFSKVEVETILALGVEFFVAKCSGFNYDSYKRNYLDIEKEKFYTIPKCLPVGKCYFLDRYYR